jgi:hypothetical protein
MGASKIERIEITLKPILENRRLGVFGRGDVNLAEEKIAWLSRTGTLRKEGKEYFHRETGILIEFRMEK